MLTAVLAFALRGVAGCGGPSDEIGRQQHELGRVERLRRARR